MGAYWYKVFARAWRDLLASQRWRARPILRKLIVGVAAAGAAFYFTGNAQMILDKAGVLLFVVFAAVALALLEFAYHLLAVPARMAAEGVSEIAELRKMLHRAELTDEATKQGRALFDEGSRILQGLRTMPFPGVELSGKHALVKDWDLRVVVLLKEHAPHECFLYETIAVLPHPRGFGMGHRLDGQMTLIKFVSDKLAKLRLVIARFETAPQTPEPGGTSG